MRRLRVELLALGNGALGAEKQALALRARLRDQLLVQGVRVVDPAVELLRVPLTTKGWIPRRWMPPALQIAMACIKRDPFFGYDVTDAHKRWLLGEHDVERSRGKQLMQVVIGCGRTTVAMCAMLRIWRRWHQQDPRAARIFNIQIQHPRVPLRLFDAVVMPRHDIASSSRMPENVFPTIGTMSLVHPQNELSEQAIRKWETALASSLQRYPTRVAWLVGGPCRGFGFSLVDANAMVDQVLNAIGDSMLLVTFSRRTPPEVQELIRSRLGATLDVAARVFIWDGHGSNPLEWMLHTATAIITTPDSISMTSEAILHDKPVFTVCTDRIQGKFRRFHATLQALNMAPPLTAAALRESLGLSHASPSPGDRMESELAQVAQHLAHAIVARGAAR